MSIKLPTIISRVQTILSEKEVKARSIMSIRYLTVPETMTVGNALSFIRTSGEEAGDVSYLYLVDSTDVLVGVIDLRDLVLSSDDQLLKDFMESPVVTISEMDTKDDITELLVKYHFRMLPVVSQSGKILGVVRYSDLVKKPTVSYRSHKSLK